LSVSRNLSRMIQLYGNEFGSERKTRILNLIAAYPYLLRQHIRPGCLCAPPDQHIPKKFKLLLQDSYSRRNMQEARFEGQRELQSKSYDLIQKLSNNVGGDEYDDVRKQCWVDKRHLPWSLFKKASLPQIAIAENRPLWVCDRIAAVVMTIPYGPNFTSRERLTLLKMVDSLTNAIGQCERIHQTAVPLNYARHSLRSLTLWLFTLPFALVKDMGLFTAIVNACIAWLLFGVYQIGYSIEDPFQGSLRLSILCDAIRRNVIGQSDELRDSAFSIDDVSTALPYDFPVGVDLQDFSVRLSDSPEPASDAELLQSLVDKNLLVAPKFVGDGNCTYLGCEVGI
jgi:predicted membrane chloride channel (bestrophin family)